jgi:flagellar biogenesis protein FliO
MVVLQQYTGMITAAIVVLAVVLVTMLVFRALSRNVRGRKGARLGISEYYEIDKTRRLVIIRRDDREHLVLIGGPQDVVIESNINDDRDQAQAAEMPQQQPAYQPLQPVNLLALRNPPRPAIFGDRRPELRPVDPNPGFRNDDQK